jgi:hypothetical protein
LAGGPFPTLADCTVFPTLVFCAFMLPRFDLDVWQGAPTLRAYWQHMTESDPVGQVKSRGLHAPKENVLTREATTIQLIDEFFFLPQEFRTTTHVPTHAHRCPHNAHRPFDAPYALSLA